MSPERVEEIAVLGTRAGITIAKLDGSISHLMNAEKELRGRVPISRLPKWVLDMDQELWHPIAWGRWRMTDHITLGEARAVVSLLQRLAANPGAHRHRIVSLQDNMSVAGAVARGRSPSLKLNYLLRRISAIILTGNFRLLLSWVDTAHQFADWLSRIQ